MKPEHETKHPSYAVLWRRILAVLCIALFGILLGAVLTESTEGFDDPIRSAFYWIRSVDLTQAVIALTNTANKYTLISFCIILLILPWTRMKFGIPLSAGALGTTILNHIIKELVERPRPIAEHLVTESGFSFPSGHSTSSMFFYGMAIWLVWHYVSREDRMTERVESAAAKPPAHLLSNRPLPVYHKGTAVLLTILLLIPLLLVGPTRIYLGVHFPTDVLAGWCLGGFGILLEVEIIEALERRKSRKS